MECNSLLDGRQHGFRRNFSTVSAIIEVTQFLFDNIDQGNIVHCAFIDYSKAFDTLNHEILCRKLHNLGFGRQIVSWCRSYLAGREQCVKVQNENSPSQPFTCGVPQGSILGPLFFIIYVNDLLKQFYDDNLRITLYADDTVLYTAHKNSHESARRLGEGLAILSEWCIRNRLTLSLFNVSLE